MFQNPCKFGVIEHPVLDRGLSVHLIYIFVSKSVSHCSKELSKAILMDEAIVIIVKASKGIFNYILWIGPYKLK